MAASLSRPDPSSPASVAEAAFNTARRGFQPDEVRAFLVAVAAEMGRLQERERQLEAELSEARSVEAPTELDDETVANLLGEETLRVLHTARESASQIKIRAEEAAARILREANDEVNRLRQEADVEMARRRQDAASDAEAEVALAKQQGREMVNEARAYRERVLADLERRTTLARQQIEELIHGRDRLLQVFERARLVAVDVTSELTAIDSPDELVNLTPTTGPVPIMVPNERRPTRQAGQPVVDDAEPATEPRDSANVGDDDGEEVADDDAVDRTDAAHENDEPDDEAEAADQLEVTDVPAAGDDAEADVPAAGDDAEADDVSSADDADDEDDADATTADDDAGAAMAQTDDAPDATATTTDTDTNGTDTNGTDTDTGTSDASGTTADTDKTDAAVTKTDTGKAAATKTDTNVVSLFRGRTAPADAAAADDHPSTDSATTRDADTTDESSESGRRPDVGGIFERLRQEVPDSESATDPTPGDTTAVDATGESISDTTAADDTDESVTHATAADDADGGTDDAAESTPFTRRDEALVPLIVSGAKRLKRVLADEQNEALDTLRRGDPVTELDALVAPVDEHVATYLAALDDDLQSAAVEGAGELGANDTKTLRKSLAKAGALDRAAAHVRAALVGPLRDRLDRAISDGAGDNDDITKRVRAVYREWKTQHIDDQLDDLFRSAYNGGFHATLAPGTPLVWTTDPRLAPCPDCEDNSLADGVAAGDEFPTGHANAPAHPGCTCLAVPAD